MQENKYRKETRYWCGYCKMFVYNNLACRQKHESTPKHKNAIERHLRNAYRQKDVQEKEKHSDRKLMDEIERKASGGSFIPYRTGLGSTATPASTQKEKRIVNRNDYGYDGGFVQDQEPFDPKEYKVSTEFAQQNQQTIHTTRIGEWEVVEDPESDSECIPLHPNPPTNPAAENVKNVVEYSDGSTPTGFTLGQKRINTDLYEINNQPDISFKKRTFATKSFRKK
jgi:hypothetical protein